MWHYHTTVRWIVVVVGVIVEVFEKIEELWIGGHDFVRNIKNRLDFSTRDIEDNSQIFMGTWKVLVRNLQSYKSRLIGSYLEWLD